MGSEGKSLVVARAIKLVSPLKGFPLKIWGFLSLSLSVTMVNRTNIPVGYKKSKIKVF